MKNKILTFILSLCMILPGVVLLSGCEHEHTYSETWYYNETHHWRIANCEHEEEKIDYAEHIDEDEDLICDICKYNQVASIGEVGYASLEDAIVSALPGETIVLNQDIDLIRGIAIFSEITIDLNNKKLTARGDIFGDGIFWVDNGGDLTINGDGIIDAASQANDYSMAIWAKNGGKVTINGGTFTNVGADDWDDAYGVYNNNELIYAGPDGEIVINGGTFIGNTANEYIGAKFTLNLKDNTTGKIVVKGGTFENFDPSSADTEPGGPYNFVADGYYVQKVDDSYIVCEHDPMASIAGVEYNSFKAAINAAPSGSTVVLLDDINLTSGVVISKEITIELNGKTISAENCTSSALLRVEAGGKLTINGEGTINSASQANDYSMAVWARNGGEIVINGGIFTNLGAKDYEDNGTTPNNNELIYSSGAGSVITINGGKFIGNYENVKWGTRYALNLLDNSGASIVVKGGEFYLFNPSASLSEYPQANFVAEGYTVQKVGATYKIVAE